MFPDRDRFVFTLLVGGLVVGGLVVTASACGSPGSGSVDSEQDLARRSAIREGLRESLGDGYDEPIPTATMETVVLGATIYTGLCAGCHGERGDGEGYASATLTVPPGDLTDPERAGFYSDAAKLEIMREGIAGSPMVGWREVVTDENLLAVFQYVRTLSDPSTMPTGTTAEKEE